MTASIICPLYKGAHFLKDLHKNLLNQKGVNIAEIKYILTKAENDNSEEILKKLNANYETILPKDFSHSLVREKAGFNALGDIIVFITQDIKIVDEKWLYHLTKDIDSGKCAAAFSRQIGYPEHKIEKYIREINYPEQSRIVSKEDIPKLGLMTFFFSDASGAVNKEIFIKLNGYDNKNLPTSEDMYLAYKLIDNGYKIKYEADSKIIHSHELSFKDTYKRYEDIGKFFAQNPYLKKYSANSKGVDVLKYIIKRSFQDKKPFVVVDTFSNFGARFLGMRSGKKQK